jgi:predicted PurR-regulated permease PerM
VSGSSETWLATMAIATAAMAMVQIAVLVGVFAYGARLIKRIESLVGQVQEDLKPISANLTAVSQDAARVASMATLQAERADRLLSDFTTRLDETMTLVQGAIVAPAREGYALVAGVKAALAAFRDLRNGARRRGRLEEDDALFI